MDIVISHIAALQVIRQPYFPRYLATAELCPSALPAHLPSPAELKEAHKTCGQLAGIEGDLGLLISSKKGTHACAGARPHVYSGAVPPGALVQLAPGIRCVSPLFLPLLVISKLTEVEMLMLLAELMGLYSVANGEKQGLVQRDTPMATPEGYRAFLNAAGRPMWSAKLERLIGMAPVRAASPPEAQLYLRATARFARGGYGLAGAILNDEVELTELAGAVPATKKRKPDLLVSPVHKDTSVRGACIDYMGSEWHTSADVIKNDAIRRNELLAAGYIPFEIFKDQFADIDYMDGLMRSVREAAGLPARKIGRARAKKERSAREELWARLSSVDVRAWTSREKLR